MCLIVSGFGKLNPSSGIATAYEALAQLLAADGYNVTVAYMNREVTAERFAAVQSKYRVQLNIDLVR